jgi:hypothetical protein
MQRQLLNFQNSFQPPNLISFEVVQDVSTCYRQQHPSHTNRTRDVSSKGKKSRPPKPYKNAPQHTRMPLPTKPKKNNNHNQDADGPRFSVFPAPTGDNRINKNEKTLRASGELRRWAPCRRRNQMLRPIRASSASRSSTPPTSSSSCAKEPQPHAWKRRQRERKP